MKSTDVFISGAGIAGLITAILCTRLGLHVTLSDPNFAREKIMPSTRTSALMEESLNILKSADLYAPCEPKSSDLKSLSITDISLGSDAAMTQIFHAHEIGQTRFGRNIINSDLQCAALERVQSLALIECVADEIVSINTNENHISLTLKSGKIIKAKLLIGADGRKSIVRTLSGIKTWEHDYKQSAITGVVSHTKPHNHISTEFHRDGGPFTLVPLADDPLNGMQSSFVFMNGTEESNALLKLSKPDFTNILQQQSQNCLGTLNLTSPLESFPIMALKAARLIAPRTALIAEAAHVLSPIGAQGLNLSLRDIDCLITIISDTKNLGLDIGSKTMLEKFENERMNDIAMRVRGTDILNRAVKFLPPPLKHLRRFGLNIAGEFTPLRHSLMMEGLRGTSPKNFNQSRTARAIVTT